MIGLFPSRAIALSVGPVDIHWYGIMYLLAFLLGMLMLPRLLRYRTLDLSDTARESLLVAVFFGVLLGGRLGFVLFYGGMEYVRHPLEIFAVWQGGMSSHGGFIGVTLALLLFARRHSVPFLALADALVVPIAIGLAFGRIGNLINGELYGTVTMLPWGMRFSGVEGLRHPTQVYECVTNVFVAAVCWLHLRMTSSRRGRSGRTTALFLSLYALFRLLIEFFRDQQYGYAEIGGFLLSRGQLLTLPLLLVGIGLWIIRRPSVRA